MENWLRSGSLKRKERDDTLHLGSANSAEAACESDINISGASAIKEISSGSCSKKKYFRKYDTSYLEFGFTWCGNESEPKPQCVVCYEVLSNECMKPAKLKRHLETKHANVKSKPVEFFQRCVEKLNKEIKLVSNVGSATKKALETSYIVSLHIAKSGKPHSIGETLILPAAKDIVKTMFGEKLSKDIDLIPLSDDTVTRRINDMAKNVESELISRIKESSFYSLQIDETTDVSNDGQLICYVRYEFNNDIHEDMLFSKTLPSRSTGEQIFKALNEYMQEHEIDWKKCVGFCSDGARALTGRQSGVVAKVKDVAPDVTWTHCFIHREALATKGMPSKFKTVLEDSVKIINFIKARPLNSRLFSLLCDDMGSEHKQLLLHSEVRWLSRGKVLTRLFELRQEVLLFVKEINEDYTSFLVDDMWLSTLAYLSDVFSKLNELNLSLQGNSLTVLNAHDKIKGFERKLGLWVSCVKQRHFSPFPTLEYFFVENDLIIEKEICDDICSHLETLRSQFENYFPSSKYDEFSWVRDPFHCDIENNKLSLNEREQLIELSNDAGLKIKFQAEGMVNFWTSSPVEREYSELYKGALKIIIQFASTYLCEKGFSSLTEIKTKYRNRLDVCADLRLKLTSIHPNIEQLCKGRQAHPSH